MAAQPCGCGMEFLLPSSWANSPLQQTLLPPPSPLAPPKSSPASGAVGRMGGAPRGSPFCWWDKRPRSPPSPPAGFLEHGRGLGGPLTPRRPPTLPPQTGPNENKLVPGCGAGGGGGGEGGGGGGEGEGGGSIPAGSRKGREEARCAGQTPILPAPSRRRGGCRRGRRAPAPGEMAAVAAWLLMLLVVVATPPALSAAPRHAAVLPDGGGSGDGEEVSAAPPVRPVTPGIGPTVGDAVGTTVTNSSAPGGVLDGLVDFFKEYMLLVVVVGSLAFVLLFIICAAVIVRQKHKASAYYPSSFPKKKYVDERDKVGGARAFNEVPEKAPDPNAEEPLDCGRQLQADILAAAQNLKSPPSKAPLANGARGEQKSPPEEEEEEEEGSKKLGDEQPAEPPPQNPGAEEAAGATGAAPGGPQAPPSN
ncbi:PREDICTED: transmembrane protein 119 [Calidris pugnax]|uniref:transmembrane protein 119 n=1 Tax=Calidris pugnax TaxID=198806 RepID=UPI00071C445E|nr:PREDICTED: transmembrane protein 119 [Calidris pugnax]